MPGGIIKSALVWMIAKRTKLARFDSGLRLITGARVAPSTGKAGRASPSSLVFSRWFLGKGFLNEIFISIIISDHFSYNSCLG